MNKSKSNIQSKSSSGLSQIQLPKNGPELLCALKKYFQPWKRLYLVEGILQKHGLQPFVDILNIPIEGNSSDFQSYHNPLFRALAIQSFSYIQTLAEKEKIASLKSVFSRNLLSILQKEATGGANQLIRWSAAKTINSIWFDPQWSEQDKHHYSINAEYQTSNTEIDRIEKQITEQELDGLDRLKNISRKSKIRDGGLSEDYQKYLEFWVYGPSSVLFNLDHKWEEHQSLIKSEEYGLLIEDVLWELGPIGVELGLGVGWGEKSTNNLVVELSLECAKKIFNDSAYHDNYLDYNQWKISNCLEPFLQCDSEMQKYQPKVLDFRKLAAESIMKLKDELWKNDNKLKALKARAAVILQDWKLVEQLGGEITVGSLLQVGQGFLQLEAKANLNLDIQIKAVGTIGKIKFKNNAEKINALCQFLQLPEQRIRYESALLLRPYLNDLKPKSYAIVTALLYEFNNKSLFSSLDISSIEQIKKYINDAENEQIAINSIFEKASNSCENNAFEVKKFFEQKLNEYQKIIKPYIEKLKGHLSKVEKLQALVQQSAQLILSTFQGIKSAYPYLYSQLIDWEKKAKEIANTPISSYSFNKAVESQQKIESLKNGIYSGLLEAIQYLETKLKTIIASLDFAKGEEIKKYIDDTRKEWEAIHKAFECVYFSSELEDLSYFKQKFDKFEYKINDHLKTLNNWLLKINNLQAEIKQNVECILSNLEKIKSVYPNIYNQLIDWEKKAKEIKNTPISSYSLNKAVESKQKIEHIKNCINSGLLKSSQDLETELREIIDRLDSAKSEEIIHSLRDGEIKKYVIYDVFSNLFSKRYGNDKKFDASLLQIDVYLKNLNNQLSKIQQLQALVQPNTELIISTLLEIKKLLKEQCIQLKTLKYKFIWDLLKSTYKDLQNDYGEDDQEKLEGYKKKATDLSGLKEGGYSYQEIDCFMQNLAKIKNSINSSLLQVIKDWKVAINKLTDKDEELKRSDQENSVWWRNFATRLALFTFGLVLIFVLYWSDYGLAKLLVTYNNSWQFRVDGLGVVFLSLLWLPFHLFLTWLFLLIYFAGVPLFFVWYAFKLLKHFLSLPKQIKRTSKIKKDFANARSKLTKSEELRKKLTPKLEKILNELSNNWEYMK